MEQRTKEWFDARRGRITASDAGAILGLAPYRTRDEVMRAKVRETLYAPSEFTGNIATEWGVHNEAGAVDEFEFITGIDVTPAPFVALGDWAGASPDGYTSDGGLIEVKCPFGIRDKLDPQFKSPDEQPHYVAQMQVQMHVTGKPHCHFWQWTMHGCSRDIIQYNREEAEYIMDEMKRFHDEYLIELRDNADMHLAPLRATIDTPESHKMMVEYDELTEAIDNATARKKELLAKIVEMAGEKDAIFAGRKLTLSKRNGTIAYAKAINALLPDADLEPYRGAPTSFWGIR